MILLETADKKERDMAKDLEDGLVTASPHSRFDWYDGSIEWLLIASMESHISLLMVSENLASKFFGAQKQTAQEVWS
jgi:hypothetical protein